METDPPISSLVVNERSQEMTSGLVSSKVNSPRKNLVGDLCVELSDATAYNSGHTFIPSNKGNQDKHVLLDMHEKERHINKDTCADIESELADKCADIESELADKSTDIESELADTNWEAVRSSSRDTADGGESRTGSKREVDGEKTCEFEVSRPREDGGCGDGFGAEVGNSSGNGMLVEVVAGNCCANEDGAEEGREKIADVRCVALGTVCAAQEEFVDVSNDTTIIVRNIKDTAKIGLIKVVGNGDESESKNNAGKGEMVDNGDDCENKGENENKVRDKIAVYRDRDEETVARINSRRQESRVEAGQVEGAAEVSSWELGAESKPDKPEVGTDAVDGESRGEEDVEDVSLTGDESGVSRDDGVSRVDGASCDDGVSLETDNYGVSLRNNIGNFPNEDDFGVPLTKDDNDVPSGKDDNDVFSTKDDNDIPSEKVNIRLCPGKRDTSVSPERRDADVSFQKSYTTTRDVEPVICVSDGSGSSLKKPDVAFNDDTLVLSIIPNSFSSNAGLVDSSLKVEVVSISAGDKSRVTGNNSNDSAVSLENDDPSLVEVIMDEESAGCSFPSGIYPEKNDPSAVDGNKYGTFTEASLGSSLLSGLSSGKDIVPMEEGESTVGKDTEALLSCLNPSTICANRDEVAVTYGGKRERFSCDGKPTGLSLGKVNASASSLTVCDDVKTSVTSLAVCDDVKTSVTSLAVCDVDKTSVTSLAVCDVDKTSVTSLAVCDVDKTSVTSLAVCEDGKTSTTSLAVCESVKTSARSFNSSNISQEKNPDKDIASTNEAKSAAICAEKRGMSMEDATSTVCSDAKPSISANESIVQSQSRPTKYKCLKCSRVMKDKRLIENHSCDNEAGEEKIRITIVLDKEKKSFMCKECEYTSSGHSFEEHLMCHLMVRPYQCLYCEECFINRKEISRHVLKAHNGAKMSCALRALRKAKALIKEVTSSGVVSFMAKVAGKVPLEKDPDKKKKSEDDNNVQNVIQLDKAGENMVEPHQTGQSKTELNIAGENRTEVNIAGENRTEVNIAGENRTEVNIAGENVAEPNKTYKDSVNCREAVASEVDVSESASENAKSLEGCSRKLRNALTLKSSEISDALTLKSSEMSDSPRSNSNSPKAEIHSDSSKSDNDSGLKIVASFSLQDMKLQESQSEDTNHEDATHMNFIMSSQVKNEKTGEILSFLGPETPIFTTRDTALMLPPPPLQHAPVLSSHGTPQSQGMHLKLREKNPNFFVCGFNCPFSSMSTSDFREHIVNAHSSETHFPCYYCGHHSLNESDLFHHISSHAHVINSSAPLYVCRYSDCRFGTNMVPDYINHVRTSHPDIRDPMCYSCGDTFPEPSLLQSHMEENVIHIVNCPHCSSKATERKPILNHISSEHPGKPKMVSVAKQLICHDRKVNRFGRLQEMLPPALTPAPLFTSSSGIDPILTRQDFSKEYSKPDSSSLQGIVLSRPSPSPIPSPTPREISLFPQQEATAEGVKSPTSESSDFDSTKIKEELNEDPEVYADSGGVEDPRSAYILDENGVRRRVYVPMSERRAENYRCKHCTFIARDFKRMHCHEKSHGMPPTKKERFKCMFCPQGFDSELKFRLHITCHPGLIKFLLYRCKKCEFDTNQKHTIVRHITCNRDRKHRGFGPIEDQYTVVSRSLESRVLECEKCDYMTRHKIHMAIHYQRKHNILRDKGEFTLENSTPTDTPLSSYGDSPIETASSSPLPYSSFQSPASSNEDSFDFTKPSGSAKKSKDKFNLDSPVLTSTQITERNDIFNKMVSQQAALQPGQMMENQMRKFKCPICKYLLPKAADLKNHVKRHSEVGQITLVMFRCKYCSCMSTARELLFEHLTEKHPGKAIALVKKIVAIDTTEVDKSFAETSMEESLDQLEVSLHKEMMLNLNSRSPQSKDDPSSYEQLFVIPEGEDTFETPLQCPKCSYTSTSKWDIIEHVNLLHPEVRVIGSDDDVDKLARATSEGIEQATKPSKPFPNSQEEVLILPDDQVFSEPALCSRCEFSTMLRRDMVIHLQQNHPEICVMGRNSYPVQVSAMGHLTGPMDESCVVGSGTLDARLRCLYENYGTQMKCLICGAERPKKFFIHVHILRHLNVYLWKCSFCAHRGLQKYKMVDHITKIHPGKPLSVRYLRVNVEEKVANFLSQFSVIKNRKASLDEGNFVPFISPMDELSDQASSDSCRSRQKSPGPGGSASSHSLGSEELDDKISCMYDGSDRAFRCRACQSQFQRKFAIHRHIVISHLKVALLSCGYCGMEGVERHQLVDHILACHKPAPISILTLDIDLKKMALDFLAKMAAKEHGGSLYGACNSEVSHSSEGQCDQEMTYFSSSKNLKPGPLKLTGSLNQPKFRFGNKGLSAISTKKAGTVDPTTLMLGKAALDGKLNCLYQERASGQLRCLVCRWEFPRKYPLHRHIMLRHLKMSLVGCPYCPFEGIEKYNVSAHIKDVHSDMPISIKFIQPDVDAKVREFVDDMASTGGMGNEILIRKPKSKKRSFLSVSKVERESEVEEDDDDEDEAKAHRSHGGLVVAMFGKKKQPKSDFVVKTEVEDDEFEEGDALNTNDDDDEGNNDYNEDEDPGADKSSYKPSFSSKTSSKPLPINSYTPGSYRSPAGGKAKALDVITKIKVLKSKEGPVMKFYCEKCKFTSLHRSNIVRHIYKIHEKYQTHTCPLCNYQTLSLMLMQKHKDKAHPSGDPKVEDPFPLASPKKSLMASTVFKKKQRSLVSKKQEAKTVPNVGSTGPKHFACAYCYYETHSQEDILQHTRDNHAQGSSTTSGNKSPASSDPNTSKPEDRLSACWDGSKKAVKRRIPDEDQDGVIKRKRRFIFEKGNELIHCGHCDAKETSISRMQEHMSWDHPGLPFKAKQVPSWRFLCKSCAVKTMATSKMKYHLNRHINYRPYTCVTCGDFFPSPDQCRRHSRSQAHEEQYTYVRNPKKESRVEELLEGTRQLALKVQEEAAKNPDFDMSQTDTFIAKFQESKGNLKRSLSGASSKKAKKAAKKAAVVEKEDERTGDDDDEAKKLSGKSPQTLGVEQDITIKCYNCEFTAGNVNSVNVHHKQAHPGKKFLWTEIERGFTCDSTGEALVDCDSVPGASTDVGYTTRMTLGSGSNTMRFKCKTCDFSSYVIQAMKSHLKSHQPKGFICPYCSRSFSGKEKLMRHQYCLHKGQPLWVIHLRRPGVTGSTSVKKGKGTAFEDSSLEEEALSQNPNVAENESEEPDKSIKKASSTPTTFLCSECPFTSESLYHFRLHLTQEHEEYRKRIQDPSTGSTPKISSHASSTELGADLLFQCAYCELSASDRSTVEQHLADKHSSLDPKVLEITESGNTTDLSIKDLPLLLNLKPNVAVERIPDSVLSQYVYPDSDKFDESESDGEGIHKDETVSELCRDGSETPSLSSIISADVPNSCVFEEDRLLSCGGASKLNISDSDDDNEVKNDKSGHDENVVTNIGADTYDSSLNLATDSDELARELGLVEDETSCVLGSETDMMIMQFGGIVDDKSDNLQIGNCDEGGVVTVDEETSLNLTKVQSSSSVFCSKDSTLYAAQDSDDDMGNFDNDITLASPLPMISLGDSVSISPVNAVDNGDDCEMAAGGRPIAGLGISSSSELLMDI